MSCRWTLRLRKRLGATQAAPRAPGHAWSPSFHVLPMPFVPPLPRLAIPPPHRFERMLSFPQSLGADAVMFSRPRPQAAPAGARRSPPGA
eukprot:236836-Pyramimonas_sp.AAC.1